MNLLFTFRPDAKNEKNLSTSRYGLPSGNKVSLDLISKNFSSKRLPPIPSSLTSSKSEKVFLSSQAERINLKSDSQASRVKITENYRESSYFSKALSGNQGKRNRFYLDQEELEPKTPTFQPEYEKIEDLKNLNKKIEQEYKISSKKGKIGSFSSVASQGSSSGLGRVESLGRFDKVNEMNSKNSVVSSILNDFPFFTSPNKDFGHANPVEFLTERRENASKKQQADKMLSKILQPVRQSRPKITTRTKRERPRITESSGSLPQGVFTIKHL
jgi:hypothetical protein